MISFAKIADSQIIEPKMSASFVPDHKASMVLFLDRVYGIDNQDFLLHVLEVGFLPDMRAAASLDTVSLKRIKTSAGVHACHHQAFSSAISGGFQYD